MGSKYLLNLLLAKMNQHNQHVSNSPEIIKGAQRVNKLFR